MSKVKALTIPGDMTIYEAEEIKSLFDKAAKSKGNICVNLENVSEIDSAGIQLMISLKKTLIENDREVTFESHTEAVINLFDVFDIATYFGDPIIMDNQSGQSK